MGRRLTISLGRHATVFQAKIYAILACVYEIQMNAGSEHDISICADSQMALTALRAAKNSVAIGMAVPKGAECYIYPPLCGTLLCPQTFWSMWN